MLKVAPLVNESVCLPICPQICPQVRSRRNVIPKSGSQVRAFGLRLAVIQRRGDTGHPWRVDMTRKSSSKSRRTDGLCIRVVRDKDTENPKETPARPSRGSRNRAVRFSGTPLQMLHVSAPKECQAKAPHADHEVCQDMATRKTFSSSTRAAKTWPGPGTAVPKTC